MAFNPQKYITGFIQKKITGVLVGRIYDWALNFIKEYGAKNNQSFIVTFNDDNDPMVLIVDKEGINELINKNSNIIQTIANISEYKEKIISLANSDEVKNFDFSEIEKMIPPEAQK